MAELSVGLARSVLEGTLSKAQAAIVEETKLRDIAQRDLVFITGEFEMMQAFLRVAIPERVENPVVLTWVRQIRELAYDVEDCIEFVIHLDNKPTWWFRMIPGWVSWCLPMASPLDDAVDEIERLKARVADVSTRNTRYSLIGDTGSKPAMVQQQPKSAAMLISAWTRHQQGDLRQVFPKGDDSLQVISVIGTAGDVGVTSIIWKAYNDSKVCQNFTRRAWLKLMHPFNPNEFVRSLMDQFYAHTDKEPVTNIIGFDALKYSNSEAATPVVEDPLDKLARQLNQERYLVVLEDLSTMADWEAIRKFFPATKIGSCIIISTQQSEVATLSVGHPCQVWELDQFAGVDHCIYAFYREGSQCDGDKHMETESIGAETSNHGATDSNYLLSNKMKAADDWIKEHPIVGRETEMHDLRQCTVDATFYKIQVMSVWGIIGVGKSTLVKNLFCDIILEKEVDRLFDRFGWVDVSYPFNLRDFSQSLLLNFNSDSLETKDTPPSDMVVRTNYTADCREILKRSRCLVVIDGLRSTTEWDLIETALVSGSSDNCIIVITSEATIAKRCRGDRGNIMFNVKGLEAESAFNLLKTKVSTCEHPLDSNLSSDEVAALKQLVSKCGGLPKVIAEIARTLGTKSVEQMDFARSLSNKFMHHLENSREFVRLESLFGWIHTYLRICPDSLKPCIFYLSMFPGDRIIRRRRLIRRWIAEGYSRDNHEESAEENGDKQFSDLIDLTIIQRPPQNLSITAHSDARITSCQVNGFIREYIVWKQMEENLVFELGGSSTLTTQRTGRHLVIFDSWKRDRIVFESIDFSRLRSLTVFGDWVSFFISESMKLLRVLDLENASELKYDDLKNILNVLLRLKFLSLRGHREIYHLPGSLHKLSQLQTLDIRGTSITTLPEKISKCQKLQYIRAGTIHIPVSDLSRNCSSWLPEICRSHCHMLGVEVPPGIGKLTSLHTLGVVNVAASGSKSMVKQLKKLTQLRKLGVCGINRSNSKRFFSAIKDLQQLESLSVQFDRDSVGGCCFKRDNQGYFDDEVSLPSDNLKSLKLLGLKDRLPKWKKNQLTKLAKVGLEMNTLTEDDMTLLGELPGLGILRIKLLLGGELNFSVKYNAEETDSYKEVKVLQIACSCSSDRLKVSFGSLAMKKLELLKIDCCGAASACSLA